MNSEPKLKVAVIGVGYLGRFHALIYSRLPNVELVGVVDTDDARSKAVAAEAGCAAYGDPAALFDKVDAVSVVVPTSVHLAAAKPFLARGIHVLLEKPIAVTRDEGAELVALAAQNHAILQIGHLERFNAGVMALAARITQPRYIEAQRMGGFVERAADVDVVSDLMIHDIDIILSLVDAELTAIDAIGTPVLTELIDIASARLTFANATVANVVSSRVSDKKTRRIRVFQPNTYLSLDFIEQTLDIAYPSDVPKAGRPDIVRERIHIEPVKPLDREIDAFIDCVRNNGRPLVDGAVGLRALEVAIEVQSRIRQPSGVCN